MSHAGQGWRCWVGVAWDCGVHPSLSPVDQGLLEKALSDDRDTGIGTDEIGTSSIPIIEQAHGKPELSFHAVATRMSRWDAADV